MIRSIEEREGPIEINLNGPDGNAYVLLGIAKKLSRELGYTKEHEAEIQQRMMSSDYENLLTVLDEEFGEYIIMYR